MDEFEYEFADELDALNDQGKRKAQLSSFFTATLMESSVVFVSNRYIGLLKCCVFLSKKDILSGILAFYDLKMYKLKFLFKSNNQVMNLSDSLDSKIQRFYGVPKGANIYIFFQWLVKTL